MVPRSQCSTERAVEGVWGDLQVKGVSSFDSVSPRQSSTEQIRAVEYSLPFVAYSHFHLR